MSITGGSRLSAPLGLQEVYNVLGVNKSGTYYDVGYICGNAHGRINKWSKKKPIRYAQPGELTDAQFKGTTSDNNAGIYYGLQVASSAGRLGQLHDAGWQYLPPRPGTDWCRLTDFNGYDHNAKPTLNADYTGANPCIYNVDGQFSASIVYNNTGNTTGVDVGQMLPGNVSQTIGDYYPCVLIGNYARAMYNTELSGSSQTVTTLKYNNVWYTRFRANTADHPQMGTAGVTLKSTAFLIRSVYVAGVFDFRTKWVDVSSTVNAYNAFSIPGFIALSIAFKYSNPYPVLRVYQATTNTMPAWPNAASGFVLLLDFPNGNPDKTSTFRITVQSPGVGSKDFTYKVDGGLNLMQVSFKWSDIGIIPNAGGSRPSTVRGTVSYVDGSTLHGVGSFNLTVQ